MRMGKYQFKPKLVPTIGTILLLPVFISLGFWQLNRAEEKRQILDLQQKRLAMPVLPVKQLPDKLSDIEYRKLSIIGRFLNEYHIYIDNKIHSGQVGYQVITPLSLSGSDTVILVNRGWIKSTGDRRQLPKVAPVEGEVKILGTIKVRTKDIAGFSKHNRLGNEWPALVLWPDPEQLDQDIPGEVARFVLLQDKEPQDQFTREWVFINSSPEKSISYAMQWFSFAVLLMIIYLFVNIKRVEQ